MEHQGPERRSVEKVDVGTWTKPTALTVNHNPATGSIQVTNGKLISKEITTKMTVVSDTGAVYTITRKPGGVYEANSAFTWVQSHP